MENWKFDTGAEIHLQLDVPAFPNAEDAADVDWSRRIDLPAGRYVIRGRGRSGDDRAGESYSGGYYYEVDGPRRAWVRQSYLLAAQHADWPWDLTYCLEPIDWGKAWDYYLRHRVEQDEMAREKAATQKPAASKPQDPVRREGLKETKSAGVDEFGVPIADAGDLLPNLDDLFEVQE